MDKLIQKKKVVIQRKHIGFTVLLLSGMLYFSMAGSGTSSLKVDPQRLSITEVRKGNFNEYIPVNGVVQPLETVYLDLLEGGIVEKISNQGGVMVQKGDLVLTLSNSTLQKQNIDSETRLLENLNNLRNSDIAATEQGLMLEEQLIALDFDIAEQKKRFNRFSTMQQNAPGVLSDEQYEAVRDQIEHLQDKRKVLLKRIEQGNILRQTQQQQIQTSIKLINNSLEVLQTIAKSLEVRAAIDGYLSFIDARVGQSFSQGTRIGQIDQLDSFKVQVNIDQYYISQVQIGQTGTFRFDGQDHEVKVAKIYPEVQNDTFRVDMTFINEAVKGIQRGQTLQINLRLSEMMQSTIAEKGGYFRQTNGRWVYKVAADGMSARRYTVVSGRQNPRYYEVLDGLVEGDRIITSSYEGFGDAEQLRFSISVNQ